MERVGSIFQNMKELNLEGIVHTTNRKIDYKTDIYLVDTYGETQKFFNVSKITFIGGSMINHGGQNPIEPARFGLNILHGPYHWVRTGSLRCHHAIFDRWARIRTDRRG